MPPLLRRLLTLGPTNPIAVRIVQNGSRRLRHLYIRTGYLAVLIGVLLVTLLLQSGQQSLSYRQLAAAGAQSFAVVSYLQIALICVLAPVFMAGAIAQEANPRTWDVLLTTPLTAAQIVIGNLLGRLFFVAALLLSSLPLFAITQYFGGVPGDSIVASYAIALGAAALVGAIAVTLSVTRLAGRRTVFAFYVGVISYLGVTWAIDLLLRSGRVTAVTPLNPFLALHALLSPATYARPPQSELSAMHPLARLWFGSPVTCFVSLAAIASLLLAATGSLTARAAGAGGIALRERLRGKTAERNRPPRPVWKSAIAWREASARQASLPKRVLRWSFLAAGGLWGIGLVAAFHGGVSAETFRIALLATVLTELTIITLIAINLSATAVSREREDGTLDLLLTTPLSASAYLRGKLYGLVTYLAPLLAVPLGTLAIAAVYVLFDGFGRQGGVLVSANVGVTPMTLPVVIPDAAALAPIVTLPFLAFAVMTGLQWSVRSKGTISSVVAAVGVIAAVAGPLTVCGLQAGTSLQIVGPALSAMSPASLILACVEPSALASTLVSSGLDAARVSLAVGAAVAAIAYAAVVMGMHASMVRRFDQTVRRLAGTR